MEKKRLTVFIILCLLLSGCHIPQQLTIEKLAAENMQNIDKIKIDMTKQEVLEIMGNKSAWEGKKLVKNPISVFSENFDTSVLKAGNNSEGKIVGEIVRCKKHERLDYYIRVEKKDGIIDDGEICPIKLCDGKVRYVGWGDTRAVYDPNVKEQFR